MKSLLRAAAEEYHNLERYLETRHREIVKILGPYPDLTDSYGQLICHATLILGNVTPKSKQDAALRDQMADVFDFLCSAREQVLGGMLHLAYPLSRRAYETLSLMVLCFLDDPTVQKWESGHQISNSTVRRKLSEHPMGESEAAMKSLYKFYSIAAHPNRDMIRYRYLGEGNQFVLGAIAIPDLTFTFHSCMAHVDLWFWFGAVVTHAFLVRRSRCRSCRGASRF